MSEKDDNASKNFGFYKNEKSILKEQNIEGDHEDLVDKSFDTRNCAKDSLSRHTPQNRLYASKLSSFSRKVRFNEQEFPNCKLVSDIKYHNSRSQNNNLFYSFNN